MFIPNQAFLLVQKLKSAPKGFTLRVKSELEIKHLCLPVWWVLAVLFTLTGPQKKSVAGAASVSRRVQRSFEAER